MNVESHSDRGRTMRLHDAACSRGDSGYIDIDTGLMVLTAHYLRERGFCCGAGCRHCPYPPDVQTDAGRPEDAPCWNITPTQDG